jgi:hypothetical protein
MALWVRSALVLLLLLQQIAHHLPYNTINRNKKLPSTLINWLRWLIRL